MKLARIKATIELEMVICDNTPKIMPKDEEESDKIRMIKEQISARFHGENILVYIQSIKEVT